MMYSITVLAQVAGGEAATPTMGGVVVVGFLFVVLVLALFSAVTSIMGALFSKKAAKEAAKVATAAQPAAEATSGSSGGAASANRDEEDPALMAVIAAAVHTVIGDRPHRLVSVRSAGPGWAQEGRRQIFTSHRLR